MTVHEQFARVVAHAVLWWPAAAREDLAQWLAQHTDASVRSLAEPARSYPRPVGAIPRVAMRCVA